MTSYTSSTRFGDLNYRIQMEVTEVLQCVQQQNLAKLLHHDQLALQKASHRVFFGFGADTTSVSLLCF